MKAKKTLIGLAVFTLVLAAGITGVYAYQGDYAKQGPNYSPERHEAMEAAFAKGDYEAWKEQMAGRGRVTEIINQDNFAQFAKAHELAKEGKYDEADAIRAELGLRTRDGSRAGSGYGRGMKDGSHRGRGGQGVRGNHSGFVDANGDGVCDNVQ